MRVPRNSIWVIILGERVEVEVWGGARPVGEG